MCIFRVERLNHCMCRYLHIYNDMLWYKSKEYTQTLHQNIFCGFSKLLNHTNHVLFSIINIAYHYIWK